ADPSLLDRYVRQRRTVNLEYVQEVSIRNLERLSARDPAQRRRGAEAPGRAAPTPGGNRQVLLMASMIAGSPRRRAAACRGGRGSDGRGGSPDGDDRTGHGSGRLPGVVRGVVLGYWPVASGRPESNDLRLRREIGMSTASVLPPRAALLLAAALAIVACLPA